MGQRGQPVLPGQSLGRDRAPPRRASASRTLDRAVARLERDWGGWRVRWGEINRFQRNNGAIVQRFDDARPSLPVPFASARWGSLASFAARAYPGTRRWYGTSGNSFVAIVEFGPRVRAWAVTAGGESGDPASRHFNDQAARYASGDLRPVYFHPDELAGHVARTYRPGSKAAGQFVVAASLTIKSAAPRPLIPMWKGRILPFAGQFRAGKSMFAIIGIVVLLVLVFGTYVVAGGSIGVIMHALPIEMTIIGGAAVGATLVGNSMADIKALFGGIAKAFKGPKYNKKDFLDTIFLVSKLMKMLRTDGPVAVEPHIEDPKSSAIFAEYPKLMKDDTLIHLICDTLRLVVVSSGTLDPHAVEEVMDNAIKTNHHHSNRAGQQSADARRRVSRARHRRRRARRREDDGLDRSAAGDPRRDGRLGAGRHLPRRAARLRLLRPLREPRPPGDRGRRRDLRRGQADHHRLAPRPPAAAGDRGGALGHRPCEPARLRRRLRRHARRARTMASAARRGRNEPAQQPAPIIVKKVIEAAHGAHHGGAWKIAYADFVTAMMAFFLLLWILGATDEDQRRGLADYFTPTLIEYQAEQRRIERHHGRRFDRRGGQLSAPRRPDRQPRDHHPARRHRRRQ